MHGLTKEDLKGPSLNIFKPSEKDAERVEYVLDTILICYMLPCIPPRDSPPVLLQQLPFHRGHSGSLLNVRWHIQVG